MKKFNHYFCAAVFTITVLGCTNPADKAKEDLDKKLDEITRRQNQDIDNLLASLKSGGQPGPVLVSGVMVKGSSLVDNRIVVSVNAGLNHENKEEKIAESARPVFLEKNEKVNLGAFEEESSLIHLGCDEDDVLILAEKKGLEVRGVSAPIGQNSMILRANTIVLCGLQEELEKNFYTAIYADEIILNKVSYSHIGLGSISMSANKISIIGENRIESKGIDSSINILDSNASIELNVLKEIASEDNGRLILKSQGANYIESKK